MNVYLDSMPLAEDNYLVALLDADHTLTIIGTDDQHELCNMNVEDITDCYPFKPYNYDAEGLKFTLIRLK